ncbi:hypothetical protein ACWA7J_15585 [Leptothrix sp. BB-4]
MTASRAGRVRTDPADWSVALRLLAAAAVLVPLWAGVVWSS